jgi:hypothetical protein
MSGNGSEIILAIDMQNAFSSDAIGAVVKRSPLLKGMDHEKATAALASLKGLVFAAVCKDKLTGYLTIDFGQDMTMFEKVAQPMFLNVIKAAGANIGEFADWKCSVQGSKIHLEGDLSEKSMERMFSLFSLNSGVTGDEKGPVAPLVSADGTKGAADKKKLEEQKAARAKWLAQQKRDKTKKYFETVNRYWDDIVETGPRGSIADSALFLQNYARKMKRLSRNNVDPEMIQYGKFVSATLSSMVGELHGMQNKVNQRASQINPVKNVKVTQVPWRGVNYGGTWMYRYAPMYQQNIDVAGAKREYKEISEQELKQAQYNTKKMMTAVDEEREFMRKKMTEKYGISF